MSSVTQLRPSERTRPFVVAVCDVPLLGEAVRSALEFAHVQGFAGGGDIDGLLRAVRPDALIVDNASAAEAATVFAGENGFPVVHIAVQERLVRVFRGGRWELTSNGDGPTAETIRNVVAGALFAKEVPGA